MKHVLIGCLLLMFGAFNMSFAQAGTDSIIYSNNGLVLYKNKAYFKSENLYNAQLELEKLKQREDTVQCPISYNYYYNPLSRIGNYYSFEIGEYGQTACGPPSNSLSVKTIQLETKTETMLTELFTEQSIVQALKNDEWVKTLMKNNSMNLSFVNSVKEILTEINKSGYFFTESGFAILTIDDKTGTVAVRLVGTRSVGFDHVQYIQMGLSLVPQKKIVKVLSVKSNFFLTEFENGVISR